MKIKSKESILNIVVIVFIVVMLIASVLVFTVGEKPVIQSSPRIALLGLQYNPSSLIITAVLGFARTDGLTIECDPVTQKSWEEKGFWFSEGYTEYTLDTKNIIPYTNSLIKDEQLSTDDGKVYDRENIQFEFRFSTRYKSIRGGTTARGDGGYIHSFMLSKDDISTPILLYNRYPETANWYSVLAVCGIAITIIILGIVILVLKHDDELR